MDYVLEFLEYLEVVKKHSGNTINSYRIDLLEFLEFNKNNLKITKDTVTNYLNWLYERKYRRKNCILGTSCTYRSSSSIFNSFVYCYMHDCLTNAGSNVRTCYLRI